MSGHRVRSLDIQADNGPLFVCLGLYCRTAVVVWLSGSALVSISEVAVRRARLVVGWVTVFRWTHHLDI